MRLGEMGDGELGSEAWLHVLPCFQLTCGEIVVVNLVRELKQFATRVL